MRYVIIEVPHMGGEFKIPEILMLNYRNCVGWNERALTIQKFRLGYTPSNEEMIKKQTIANDMQFDAHDRIFQYLGLSHNYRDMDNVCKFINDAIHHWIHEYSYTGENIKTMTVRPNKKKPISSFIRATK